MKNTATVDLDVFNQALLLLQQLSGEVSHVKVHPIVQAFANSVIPRDEGKEACPSPTPPKSSSKRSETSSK